MQYSTKLCVVTTIFCFSVYVLFFLAQYFAVLPKQNKMFKIQNENCLQHRMNEITVSALNSCIISDIFFCLGNV